MNYASKSFAQKQDYSIVLYWVLLSPTEIITYSVMQSNGNSFCGDVVLDSFNEAFWDGDNNLD